MAAESSVLLLAAAIADGANIDWDHAESSAAGPDERDVVANLRLLAAIGGVARAQARTWGPLEIRGEVGRGAFGTVYRAWDPGLEREVALKLLHKQSTAGASGSKEGRLLAQLRHPNVVTVYGADVFDGVIGVWMEFIIGRTLKEIVASHGPLGAHEAAIIGRDLCRALAAVHQRGVLHGDVKAQNVMRAAGGRTVLMDFGAGHLVNASTSAALAGTPAYLAPELFAGGAATVQSDLYSLGVLLYFLVTGSFPVVGNSLPEFRVLHETGRRTPLRDTRPDLPAAFVRAVEQAVAPDQSQRPLSAGTLEAMLDVALESEASGAKNKVARPSLHNRRGIVWAVAVALSLAGVTAIGWRWAGGATPDDSMVSGLPRQITFAPGWEAQPALSPDGRLVAYSSNESGTAHIWISDVNGGNPVQITEGGGLETHPAWFPDGSAVAYVVSQAGHESIWKTPPLGGSATLLVGEGSDPAISPDGRSIAFARGAFKRIAVAPLTDTSRTRFVTGDQDGLWNHESPSWSPDGRTIAYAAHNALWLVHIDGSRPVRLTTDGQADRDPVWSADGRYLYFSSVRQGTEAIWRLSARGGTPERVTLGTGPERQPSISRDNSRIAYSTASMGSHVVLVSLRTGQEWRLPSVKDDEMPSFDPDHRTLAFVSNRWNGRYDLWIQGLADGGIPQGVPRRLTDQPGSVNYPAFSPDGTWVAYGRVDGEARDIWMIPAAGGAPVRLTSDPVSHFHPSWSPDGSRLAYIAGSADRYRVEYVPVARGRAAGEPVLVVAEREPPESPVWSPDGNTLAFVLENEVWIANVAEPGHVRKVTSGTGASRLRWNRSTGRLFVSGLWGSNRSSVRILDVESGKTSLPPVEMAIGEVDYQDFDVSPNEAYAAVIRKDLRGDVWVIDKKLAP